MPAPERSASTEVVSPGPWRAASASASPVAGRPRALRVRAATPRIRPGVLRLAPGGSRRLVVAGVRSRRVVWSVDGVPGGRGSLGTISRTGVFRAPSGPAAVHSVRVEARIPGRRPATAWVLLDSGVRQRLASSASIPLGCPRRVGGWTMLECPIEERNQTLLEFGERSHWIQPWRGYLDTVPAGRLRDAIGMQFNVPPAEAEATARLLAASGVRRARVEIGWGEIDDEDPGRLWRAHQHRTALGALARHGIRPLVLLNAHHGVPAPRRSIRLTTTAPAPAGARTVQIDPGSAALVIPGRTGFDSRRSYRAAEVIVVAVHPDGRAELSQPLPADLPAGDHPASVLLYEPFSEPTLEDGSPNPRFERTLAGWLDYVRVVTREARAAVGSDAFDVEVWNELTFGSDFLDIDNYYEPDIDGGTGSRATQRAILERTVAWIRDPRNGVSGVGIGDGFANQRPWESGATSPPGLTAIDRHPYPPRRRFPEEAVRNGLRPIDALGRPRGRQDSGGQWVDAFVPRYVSYFPEYFLTAVQTEHMIRDLSPATTSVYGTPHGRATRPPGAPPPEVWVTEINLGSQAIDPAARERFQAKVALRSLVSFTAMGAGAVHLFAAKAMGDGRLGLVAPGFSAAAAGGGYPGDEAGGLTTAAIRRLVGEVQGPTGFRQRRLTLLAIGDRAGRRQFYGDGSAAHPALHDRDVAAVFPFQVAADRFVVAAYVMTRDMSRVSSPRAAPERRYDLPARTYRIRLGGIRRCPARVEAVDPLDGAAAPVSVRHCSPPVIELQAPLTDSPRLITFSG